MRFKTIASILFLAVLVAIPVQAEDEKTGWHSTADFGLVVTGGNAESETIAFKDETKRVWDKSSITFKLGALRAETTKTTLVGIPANYTEVDVTEISAESYLFEGRYDHEIHERMFWFAGAGWDRNRPSGIESRTTAFGGIGNIWRDDDKILFRTDYALSYTDREDVMATPGADDSYAGARASWVYNHQFTESTQYINDFVFDYGFNESDNWRANMINAVAVSINDRLALKFSLQLLYENLPPTTTIPVFDMVGGTQTGTVPFELDELDTIASAALVVNF
jgi:putative salt-induced outer membrane protein YdiY